MPRTSTFATQNKIISKTERMIHLPNSYYLREKTERMVDLPSFNYGHQEPRIITSNLIHYLDGADNTIRGTDWYNSLDKSPSSKASPIDFSFGGINPYVEEKSFRLVNGLTNPLATSLGSDPFNTNNNLYTMSIYIRINAITPATSRILTIGNDTSFFVPYFSIFQNAGVATISFRSNLGAFRTPIVIGKKYMVTIVRNYDFSYYYVNDKFFRSDNSLIPPRVVSNTAPIVLGNITASQPNINIYGFLVYNRTLTEQEICNNYQHLKEKYSSPSDKIDF